MSTESTNDERELEAAIERMTRTITIQALCRPREAETARTMLRISLEVG